MSPTAFRKLMLDRAKEYLELPPKVLYGLLRSIRRQDKAAYDLLRECMVEVRRGENHEARSPRFTRPAYAPYCIQGFDPR